MNIWNDSKLHEEDFIYAPEFRLYLESYKKANGTGLSRKTINRHVVNVVDFLYYSSTHNKEMDNEGPDEVPVDETLLRRGKDYFSAYFVGWLFGQGESEDSIRQSVSSLRKYYKFLKETKRIEGAIAEEILEDLTFY